MKYLERSELIAEQGWYELAQDVLANEWHQSDVIAEKSQQLADRAVREDNGVRLLRDYVSRTSKLDAEASIALKDLDRGSMDKGDELEFVARRIAHGSGRQALKLVRNKAKRTTYTSKRARGLDLSGVSMGRVETKDLG